MFGKVFQRKKDTRDKKKKHKKSQNFVIFDPERAKRSRKIFGRSL